MITSALLDLSSIGIQLFTANLFSFGRLLLIPALLAGAVASYIYVPFFGKFMTIGLVAAASAIGAYQYGYSSRAALDRSLQLQQELINTQNALKQAHDDLAANQKIAADSAAREKAADDQSTELQGKVTAYEEQLAKDAISSGTPTVVTVPGKCLPAQKPSGCVLTTRDVNGLRAISGRPGSRDR